MEVSMKFCKCGSSEFTTKPNRYDIYKIMDDKLVLTDSPFLDDELKLYCRECGEELFESTNDMASNY
jgi:hypothetical protein